MYKKVDCLSLALEDFGIKNYLRMMNLESSRIFFRHRSQTMTSCRIQYGSDERNISDAFNCFSCQAAGKFFIDQLSHWTNCFSYSHLKTDGMNLNSDEDLCIFYWRVIQYRRENGYIK